MIDVREPVEQDMAQAPYPGLRPFMISESDIFFGRERMIDQVLTRLNEKSMVAVHGMSGCGKSSLVVAGVLPQLIRRRSRLDQKLQIGIFRPAAQPMRALISLLAGLLEKADPSVPVGDICVALVSEDPRAGVAELVARAGIDQLCIVIDQFEELFRVAEITGQDEAARFARLLVQLCGCYQPEAPWWEAGRERPAARTRQQAQLGFIITMRSEFLGNCARYSGLAEAINRTQYLLPNMDRDDLIRAIREPAEVFGGSVDEALAERLADDALLETDPLPLVQHALMQMWSAADQGRLTLNSYAKAMTGSAKSVGNRPLGPLGAILAKHAESVFEDIAGLKGTGEPAAKLEEAIEFIFRALTKTDREGRGVRDPQRFAHLLAVSGVNRTAALAIIKGFRGEGVSFLTPYAGQGPIEDDTVIDISHEALIRTWPKMSDDTLDRAAAPVGWLEREARDGLLWHWLAVQAGVLGSAPKLLDAEAATRLKPWFKRIRKCPEWARRHLVRPEGTLKVVDEPEWQAVEHLFDTSLSKTRLSRFFLRWWKSIIVALVASLTLIIIFFTIWYRQAWQEEMALNAQVNQESVRRSYAESAAYDLSLLMDASGSIESINSTAGGQGPAARTERVDERTALAAAPIRSGEVYVWSGTLGVGSVANLRDAAGPVIPSRVARNTRYTIAQHTIARSAVPMGRTIAYSVGIIRRGTPLIVIDPRSVSFGDRTEYWVRARLVGPVVPAIRLNFASNSQLPRSTWTILRYDLRLQLNRIGYNAGEPRVSPAAAGRANVLFCHATDRPAAVRLASVVSRWLALNPSIRGIEVQSAAGQDHECAGVARNDLILMLDFSAAQSRSNPIPTPAPTQPPAQAPTQPGPAATPS